MDLGKVALLLNGGGAKGGFQAGEIQAFLDLGLKYDMLYGSSVGSLNGVLLHQGDAKRMKEIWMTIKTADVYRWSPLNLPGVFNSSACLYDSSPLKSLIERTTNLPQLLSNPVPFYVASTNYTDWLPFVPAVHELPVEDVVTQLYASSSPPIYFPFVEYQGKRLADASIISNFCIRSALSNGADTIITMSFAYPNPTVPNNVVESAGETISLAIQGQYLDEVAMVEKVNTFIPFLPKEMGYRTIKLVKIIPPKPLPIGLLDFDLKGQNREQIWQDGYDLAKKVLTEQLCI